MKINPNFKNVNSQIPKPNGCLLENYPISYSVAELGFPLLL